MAEILRIDCSDSEEENRPASNQDVLDKKTNSSSDSENDFKPRIKKSRTVRGLRRVKSKPTANSTTKTQNASKEQHVYTGNINISLATLPIEQLKEKIDHINKISGTNDEEDSEQKSQDKGENPTTQTVEDADSDVEVTQVTNTENHIQSRSRSPTPPPTPPPDVTSVPARKRRRQKKAVQNALSGLTKWNEKQKSQPLDDSTDMIVLDDSLNSSLNSPEIQIRIKSRSGIQRFLIPEDSSFSPIILAMARHEGVAFERVAMYHEDHTIKPYDTPKSIGLKYVDIIDCIIRKEGEVATVDDEPDENDPNSVLLKIQGKDIKSKSEIRIKMQEPLEILFRKYAEKMKVSLDKLKFIFDGEELQRKETPQDLDMEDEDCIEVAGL